MEPGKVKEEMLAYCFNYINKRISGIQAAIESSQLSANEETKSSAGDKYETGRAMAQLDIERNTIQLGEARKLLIELHKIEHRPNVDSVSLGSLVETSIGHYYYLAISIGSTKIDGREIVILSVHSPLGELLKGKKAGDSITWRSKNIAIISVQ